MVCSLVFLRPGSGAFPDAVTGLHPRVERPIGAFDISPGRFFRQSTC